MSFYSYRLITPDGQEFDLNEEKWRVDIGIPDGFGLPPIAHDTQVLYGQPGSILKSVQVNPRTVTITAKLVAQCRDEMHQVRAALWQALRWNREGLNPPTYSTLRYEANGETAELHVYYLSDVTSGGDGETSQAVGYRLVAYDPYWYGATERTDTLAPYDEFIGVYLLGLVDHEYTTVGGGANGAIYAMQYDSVRNRVYMAGAFTTIGGVAANRVAYLDRATGLFSAMGVGANDTIYTIAIEASGDVLVGGQFTSIGGVATKGIARWDIDLGSWGAVSGGCTGATYNTVRDIVIDSTGNVYAGGNFESMNSVANTLRMAKLTDGVWSALDTGVGVGDLATHAILSMIAMPDDTIILGGNFDNASSVANTDGIAKWDGSNFVSINAAAMVVSDLALAPNGIVYAAANYPYSWNGTTWTLLYTTDTATVTFCNALRNGSVWFGFGGSVPFKYNFAWNGTTVERVEFEGGFGIAAVCEIPNSDDVYYSVATAVTPHIESVDYTGDAESFPVITIYGSGSTLRWIRNYENDKIMQFNMFLAQGEVATIDLTPLQKSFTSNLHGNLFPLSALLPPSDFSSWSLEPEPLAPDGINHIGLFILNNSGINSTQTDKNDTDTQVSVWRLTGITLANSDNGKLYVNIVDDGAGFWHIDFYSDSTRTNLVAHTATFNASGTKTVVADGGSGIGGTLSAVSPFAASTSIVLFTPIGKIEWYDRFLSADSAVAPDRIK